MIYVSKHSSMKIFYYLIMADRKIEPEEMSLYNEIGHKIDGEKFDSYRMDIIAECRGYLKGAETEEDYFKALCDGVDRAFAEGTGKTERKIPVRQSVWNMLAAANVDGDYSETERRLILHVVEKNNLDKSVFLEMEQIVKTLNSINRELEWVKSTDRTYEEIRSIVEELEKRYAIVVKSAEELVEDEVEGDNPYVEPEKIDFWKKKIEIFKKSK